MTLSLLQAATGRDCAPSENKTCGPAAPRHSKGERFHSTDIEIIFPRGPNAAKICIKLNIGRIGPAQSRTSQQQNVSSASKLSKLIASASNGHSEARPSLQFLSTCCS
ncbi:hypothetical protein [Bradyrhizobium sp. BR 1432]|uniref:hypothetical protein n=1 Tax=Bradyrhizobium sp. BR 1432 TaxID=3447966 RepID=UPI003EE7BD33